MYNEVACCLQGILALMKSIKVYNALLAPIIKLGNGMLGGLMANAFASLKQVALVVCPTAKTYKERLTAKGLPERVDYTIQKPGTFCASPELVVNDPDVCKVLYLQHLVSGISTVHSLEYAMIQER